MGRLSPKSKVSELAASVGFKWLATDEGILAKSGVPVWDHERHRRRTEDAREQRPETGRLGFRDHGQEQMRSNGHRNGEGSFRRCILGIPAEDP